MRKRSRKGKIRIWAAFMAVLCFCNSFQSMATEKNAGEEDTAKENQAEDNVTDMDLGSYQESMMVGEEQSLQITLTPESISGQKITYASSNEEVAEVNGKGKITALKKGTTTISAKCQEIEKSFLLTVKEDTEESKIAVTDIEIGEYEDTLEVGKTLELTTTVIPTDAADATITYVSDSPEKATVSSTGVVKGISPGSVTISVSAGKITKEVYLTVKVATTTIQLNSTYVVLKKGQSYQLSAHVFPTEAEQSITFKSVDSGIASVSDSGMITGNALGSTTIMVTNGDMTNAVTVIVNAGTAVTENGKISEEKGDLEKVRTVDEEDLVKEILEKKTIKVKFKEYPVITKSILKALYENQKNLQVESQDYILEIDGKEIINYQNELSTEVVLEKNVKGMNFEINDGENLPGTIYLKLKDTKTYKYVYLYNTSKKKYEQIKVSDIGNIELDTAGTYLLTKEKIRKISLNRMLAAGTGIVVMGIAVFYILRKKKYWFW